MAKEEKAAESRAASPSSNNAPRPPAEHPAFFVYIVESPAPVDFYDSTSEGALIASALKLQKIPAVVRTVTNGPMFNRALTDGIEQAVNSEACRGRIPIVHLSMHGSREALQLTDGDDVTWPTLRALLLPIHKALNGRLLLCLSACNGFSGCAMVKPCPSEQAEAPFYAFVSSTDKPSWDQTFVGFMTFYHLMSRGEWILPAVDAMRTASGHDEWMAQLGAETLETYHEWIALQKLKT